MDTQGKLDWIETKLKSRELQHATFKRDDDCIRLLITEVRLLVDTVAALRAERDALQAENERLRAENEAMEAAIKEALEQVHLSYYSDTPFKDARDSASEIFRALRFRVEYGEADDDIVTHRDK